MPTNPLQLLIFIPNILFAITIHECAHAWSANRLGDPTARLMGRITLNPIAHLDPIGVLCFIFAGFGWGKPVPVNPFNLRNPRRDDMLVSVAGPVSNLIAAVAFGLLFRAAIPFVQAKGSVLWVLANLAHAGVQLNVVLALFNLIPLYPLDGSHVLEGLLPRSVQSVYESFKSYGTTILLVVILLGSFANIPILSVVLGPPVSFLTKLFAGH